MPDGDLRRRVQPTDSKFPIRQRVFLRLPRVAERLEARIRGLIARSVKFLSARLSSQRRSGVLHGCRPCGCRPVASDHADCVRWNAASARVRAARAACALPGP